jgi:VWFA-related protein
MGSPERSTRKPAAAAISLPVLAAALLGFFLSLAVHAQESSAPEMTTREADSTFKMQVERNLVLVRVVVRDSHGRPVGGLGKEDFQVLDNGKPQIISHFSVESPSSKRMALTAQEPQTEADLSETTLAPSTPLRYTALYFDDIQMPFEEVARARDAVEQYLASALEPGDRVGVFTSSGLGVLDFTDDRAVLHQALFRLRSRPMGIRENDPCPDISDYQAYLIIHEYEPNAIEETHQEILHCRYNNDPIFSDQALHEVVPEAARILTASETQAVASLRGVQDVVRRMTVLPGQRNVVVISPGFLTESLRLYVEQVTDRALRAGVVISALDSRGLYVTLPGPDVSRRGILTPDRPGLMGSKQLFELRLASIKTDAIQRMALDTGGTFFNNSNDLQDGLHKIGALPEVYYVLAFSPQNLKFNGSFHTLKVRLPGRRGLTLQARRGYYAPNKSPDATTQEKQEIEQAVFSHDELHELPVDVHAQFFKLNELDARLSVLAHVDMRFVRFRKEGGRNLNDITLVAALFDRDGKFLEGKEKTLQFRLLDGSLEKLSQSGITAKFNFDVKPGAYLIRQVVRDAEGAQISALNRTVEIPF